MSQGTQHTQITKDAIFSSSGQDDRKGKNDTIEAFLTKVARAKVTKEIVFASDDIIRAVLRNVNETPLMFYYDGACCGREGYEKEVERFMSVDFYRPDDWNWHRKVMKASLQPSLAEFKKIMAA